MPDPPRVFIRYKHKVEPDQSVVDQVVEALEPHHTVFIDKKTLPSLEWGKRIQERIGEADFLIVFLTARSARSEMAIAVLKGHSDSVNSAAYSPDGGFIITASDDRTARIYPRAMFMPFDELLELARKLSPRKLTPEERERYLHEQQRK